MTTWIGGLLLMIFIKVQYEPLFDLKLLLYTVKSRVLTRVTNKKIGFLSVLIYEMCFKTRCGSIIFYIITYKLNPILSWSFPAIEHYSSSKIEDSRNFHQFDWIFAIWRKKNFNFFFFITDWRGKSGIYVFLFTLHMQ
jgi:hypothetical protein